MRLFGYALPAPNIKLDKDIFLHLTEVMTVRSKKFTIPKLNLRTSWTNVLTFLGVVAAWVPFVIEIWRKPEIQGKVISQYENHNSAESFFVFRLGLVCLNKSYYLKDVDVDIQYLKAGWVKATAINNRSLVFKLDGRDMRLKVGGSSFINNIPLLLKDEMVDGFILTKTAYFHDDKIVKVIFKFISYDGVVKEVVINENDIRTEKVLFDDGIWEPVDTLNGLVPAR